MKFSDREKAIQRYSERLDRLGATVQALGWRNKEQQYLRFEILSTIGDLHGRSVLDVGCGFGDFYTYLNERGIEVDYVGIDISPEILDEARRCHPQIDFRQVDLLVDDFGETFDYVVESGIFNHEVDDNEQFAHDMLTAMFGRCKIGIAANMMTSYVDYRDEYLYYYDPKLIFDFARILSRFVAVRHDYPLYEFTLCLYRQSPFIASTAPSPTS